MQALHIEAIHYDDTTMKVVARRNDGVVLRLKQNPPVFVRENGENRFDPIAAINAWLGFSPQQPVQRDLAD